MLEDESGRKAEQGAALVGNSADASFPSITLYKLNPVYMLIIILLIIN